MVKNKFKTIRTLHLILTFLILNSTFYICTGTVRYVSHNGSNTPPYTTWQTAADSIMSAINISVFGDTIYVANGVYEEEVVMIAGLSLIGAGADSCIIDTRNFSNPQAVGVNSDCLLKNFKVLVQNSAQTLGSGIVIGSPNSIIEFNEVVNARSAGIWCYNTNSIVRHNRVLYCDDCIQIEFNQPTIDSNYIYVVQYGSGISTGLFAFSKIRGNTVVSVNGISGFDNSNSVSKLYNNLFYGRGSYGFRTYGDSIKNNIVFGQGGNWGVGISGFGSTIINNNIENTLTGLYYDVGGGSPPVYQYNNMWDNDVNFQNFTADSTNIYFDPMFVNEDSLNFHLQMYSPLIDAGDPDILDIDGSRSDIGLYGGPFGERYAYFDLAPKPPRNLSAVVDSEYIKLTWNRNTEADFKCYKLFRDTTANFTADSTTFVIELTDTFYQHIIPTKIYAFYYKLTAADNQGNESEPSEELAVIVTSVKDFPATVSNFQLYQNYPNPFNPSTKIGYKLKERGYVKLYVYDIKGEQIDVLVNEVQEAGYYEVEFHAAVGTGQRPVLANGIYIYQIMVKSENNIPVFTDMKKMMMIK